MGSLRRQYLIAYNLAMLGGWALVALRLLRALTRGGPVAHELFSASRGPVRSLLLASCLEIVHAALKLVRSPVGTTAVQCSVRLLSFTGAMDLGCPVVSASPYPAMAIGAWTISELIRYAFYVAQLVSGSGPYWLTWLRYSAFIVLYPIGILGEMGSFYKALPHIEANKTASVLMPNRVNQSFDYASFVKVALVAGYPPGFYALYSYMLKQRAKVLGGR
jgi:very-long-chain (3R)-3-hydroxyacyl-CoA dehydratase